MAFYDVPGPSEVFSVLGLLGGIHLLPLLSLAFPRTPIPWPATVFSALFAYQFLEAFLKVKSPCSLHEWGISVGTISVNFLPCGCSASRFILPPVRGHCGL